MNEAYEIELTHISASFMESAFDIVLGVERIPRCECDEWQVMYARVLVEDRWYFLPHELYTELDEKYGELIGLKLFERTLML